MAINERQIQADLYCKIREAISFFEQGKPMRKISGKELPIDKNSFTVKVEVDVPQETSKKADIVIFKNNSPFLVIEVKTRALTQPGNSLTSASKQVKDYAIKFQSPFSAVCDGWIFILYKTYRNFWPIDIYGYQEELAFIENLLSGLVSIDTKFLPDLITIDSKNKFLTQLPKVPDLSLINKKIKPILEKRLGVKFPCV
jgi:hypothetical protein